MHQAIIDKQEEIAEVCRKYNVARLEIFGSAARGVDFDQVKSDADFLVEFYPVHTPDLATRYFGLIQELQTVLDRPVDLSRIGTIDNPYLVESINSDREVVYAS